MTIFKKERKKERLSRKSPTISMKSIYVRVSEGAHSPVLHPERLHDVCNNEGSTEDRETIRKHAHN